jgi:iron complex transport system substrate-binding protein
MDLIDAAGALDSVKMTSTQAKDWGIEKIRKLVEDGTIQYIGKYRAPDYEALLEGDIDLAIESTMIYHNPQIKEEIEEVGIPVLVERSSYEADPLGRLEWIKLYGLLLGKSEEAEAFFNEAVEKIKSVDTDAVAEAPSVAFFSVNSNGSVVVRKPGDYVTKMIETAGGTYALDGITEEEDNALSTMNMQMEAFYDKAVDADILIYNSTIEGSLESISDLTALSDKFADFKAVKEGRVWCTDASTFQKTTGVADMTVEMNRIFAGAENDNDMEYFHLLAR